jgi:hypothetical protein
MVAFMGTSLERLPASCCAQCTLWDFSGAKLERDETSRLTFNKQFLEKRQYYRVTNFAYKEFMASVYEKPRSHDVSPGKMTVLKAVQGDTSAIRAVKNSRARK